MSTVGTIVPDKDHPGAMWRVTLPSGNLSDMLNRQRAVELSRLLMLEARVQQRGTAA